jgi:methanogenic corrinoid protein MtbC1
MTDAYAKSVGADAYATDAIQGVKICQKWTQP